MNLFKKSFLKNQYSRILFSSLSDISPITSHSDDPVWRILLHFKDPDAISGFINEQFSKSKINDILVLYNEIENQDYSLSAEATRHLLHIYSKNKQIKNAEKLFNKYKENAKPTDEIYSEMLKFYFFNNRYKEAIDFCKVNVIYTSKTPICQELLYRMFYIQNNYALATEVLNDLYRNDDYLSIGALNIYLLICLSNNQYTKSVETFRRHRNNFIMDSNCYTKYIRSLYCLKLNGDLLIELKNINDQSVNLIDARMLYDLYKIYTENMNCNELYLTHTNTVINIIINNYKPFLMNDLACGSMLFFLYETKNGIQYLKILNRILGQLNSNRVFTLKILLSNSYKNGSLLDFLNILKGKRLKFPIKLFRPILSDICQKDDKATLREVFNLLYTFPIQPYVQDRYYYMLMLPSINKAEVLSIYNLSSKWNTNQDLLFILSFRLLQYNTEIAYETLLRSLRANIIKGCRYEIQPFFYCMKLLINKNDDDNIEKLFNLYRICLKEDSNTEIRKQFLTELLLYYKSKNYYTKQTIINDEIRKIR